MERRFSDVYSHEIDILIRIYIYIYKQPVAIESNVSDHKNRRVNSVGGLETVFNFFLFVKIFCYAY